MRHIFRTWKHGADIERWKQMALETTNQKHLFETSLWQAWVAWIERGQILGTENVRRKIIRIHHWFTTQTSTLAMFELDSQLNNPPLPTFWCLHELNVFAIKNSGNGFLRQTCRTNLVWHCVTFCEHGQLKGWQPRFQPTEARSS